MDENGEYIIKKEISIKDFKTKIVGSAIIKKGEAVLILSIDEYNKLLESNKKITING